VLCKRPGKLNADNMHVWILSVILLLTTACNVHCCFCCCSGGLQPLCIYRVTAVNPTVVQTGTFDSTRCVSTLKLMPRWLRSWGMHSMQQRLRAFACSARLPGILCAASVAARQGIRSAQSSTSHIARIFIGGMQAALPQFAEQTLVLLCCVCCCCWLQVPLLIESSDRGIPNPSLF
jgi:hypothetical protein